jgi:hypothetical protein
MDARWARRIQVEKSRNWNLGLEWVQTGIPGPILTRPLFSTRKGSLPLYGLLMQFSRQVVVCFLDQDMKHEFLIEYISRSEVPILLDFREYGFKGGR